MLFGMLAVSCGDDDDDGGPVGGVDCTSQVEVNAAIEAEVDALTDAALVYGNNPTTENCNDYVAALNAWLNAMQDLQDCADQAGVGAEFQANIDQAQASIDALQC